MATTPVVAAAVFSAAIRSVSLAELASTSRIWQSGQIAETMSTSRLSSSAQPASAVGSGVAAPLWLTLAKQPVAPVHGDRPYCLRYTPRSASALGLSKASTMATVFPPDDAPVRL